MLLLGDGMTLTERVCKAALETGASSKKVAAILDHDHRAVASIMAKLRAADRLPPLTRTARAAPKPYTEEDDDYLLTARRNGRKWQEIAAAMGRSVSSVEGRCKLLVLELDPEDVPPGMAESPTPRVAVIAPWPAHATFKGRDIIEGDRPPPAFAPPQAWQSLVGNAAAMCAESRAAASNAR